MCTSTYTFALFGRLAFGSLLLVQLLQAPAQTVTFATAVSSTSRNREPFVGKPPGWMIATLEAFGSTRYRAADPSSRGSSSQNSDAGSPHVHCSRFWTAFAGMAIRLCGRFHNYDSWQPAISSSC